MAYTPFDPSKPDGTDDGPTVITDINKQLLAMRDAVVMGGGFFGWNLTVSGGTAAQPTTLTYANSTERVKAVLTWGTVGGEAGNVTQAVYSYSSNSGGAYDTIATKTITYDANGYVTDTSWS